MATGPLTDKASIETCLRRHPELHLYELGDLDDFFWPYTAWYGRWERDALTDVVLVYTGQTRPTVVGLSKRPAAMQELLREVIALLPERFYAHLSPGLEAVFARTHRIEPHGPHLKMRLGDVTHVRQVDGSAVVRLVRHDLDELLQLYRESYPGNWFDPRMLDTGQYFGFRVDGALVCAAGVHVYSEQYRVAAIGNVVTHPNHRGRGYARLVTARLCQSLLETVDCIGLNVKADNEPAIACYEALGFEIVASYAEFNLVREGSWLRT